MRWRVMIELAGAEGTVQLHEVSAGGSTTGECSAETLGLTVAEGKMTLAGMQRHLVGAQAEEHCRRRRRCDSGAGLAVTIVARNVRSRTFGVGD